jgi:GTP-binding protein EngB required for normal cell division
MTNVSANEPADLGGTRTAASGNRGVLDRLTLLARGLGAASVAREADALAERAQEGRFYVVALGQFKRGKSTLINALVEQAILPAGIVPITSAVTVLRYGAATSARIRMASGGWVEIDAADLSAYVSEEENPGNEKGVAGVEVFIPASLLASGLCLVDTPGVGAVSIANSEATRAFIPQIDAALIVLGVDPPIAAEEAALVREIHAHTAMFLVVLNKADRYPKGDRDEAVRFTERVLRDVVGSVPRVYEVSAREALAGRRDRQWESLLGALRELSVTARAALVNQAVRRGITRLCHRLLAELEHERAALERPQQESEALIARLEPLRLGAHDVLDDLGHRLSAVQERLNRDFAEARDRFFTVARSECRRELVAAIVAGAAVSLPSRRRAYEVAREIAERRLDAWKIEVEPRAERLYRDAVRRFVDLANRVQQELAQIGITGLSRLDIDASLTSRDHYYPTAMMHLTGSKRHLLGFFLRRASRREALAADVADYLERLLEVNSARLTNDFVERVATSRRALEGALREALEELATSAERALARAAVARDEGRAAVTARLDWLRERRQELEEIVRQSFLSC